MRDCRPGWARTTGLAAAYRHAHDRYLADRAELGQVPEIDGVSAGGMPDRVKCLHVLVAHSLAVGPGVNPLGDEALGLLRQWWHPDGCAANRPAPDAGPSLDEASALDEGEARP
jgi:hypothetical protein